MLNYYLVDIFGVSSGRSLILAMRLTRLCFLGTNICICGGSLPVGCVETAFGLNIMYVVNKLSNHFE